MNILRKRAQQNFPMVLLTLLSIVQALALELLWEHVRESDYLLEMSRPAVFEWLQIVTTFLGIVLIWVVYASNAMRFRWTPSTADSIYPFAIGVLEFIQIEILGSNTVGEWFMLMSCIFALMVYVSHLTMKSARLSGRNKAFFDQVEPAQLKDFTSRIVAVIVVATGGFWVWVTSNNGVLLYVLMMAVLVLLGWQYVGSVKWWDQTVESDQVTMETEDHV